MNGKYLTFLISTIFLFSIFSCKQGRSKTEGGSYQDRDVKMSWIEVVCLDSTYNKYANTWQAEDVVKIFAHKDGDKLGINGSIKLIVGIDTLVGDNGLPLYYFRLQDNTVYRVEVMSMSGNKPLVYKWILECSNSVVIEYESFFSVMSDMKDKFFVKSEMPKILENKVLYPTVYHDRARWILPDYPKDNIQFTNSWISIGETTYHSPTFIEIAPDYWMIQINEFEQPLKIKQVKSEGKTLYAIDMSYEDRSRIDIVGIDTCVAEPRDKVEKYVRAKELTEKVLQGMKVSSPIYHYSYSKVSEGFLREGNETANKIESSNAYIKYKYPEFFDTPPLYDFSSNIVVNGGALHQTRYVIFPVNNSEGNEYLLLIVTNFEGDRRVMLEQSIIIPDNAKIKDFSVIANNNGGLIFIGSEYVTQDYRDEYASALCNTTGGMHFTFYRPTYKDQYVKQDAIEIKLVYDLAFNWAYVKHSNSTGTGNHGYTWILDYLECNREVVDLRKYGIRNIKEEDSIYPFWYIEMDKYEKVADEEE